MEPAVPDGLDAADWNVFPHHVLVNIFRSLNWNDRLRARAVCKLWLQAWRAPVMWRTIRLVINSKRSAQACSFLTSCIQYVKHLEVLWSSAPRKDRLRLRTSDLENRTAVADVISSIKTSSLLHTLKLYLDNPCSLDAEFINLVHCEIQQVLKENPRLQYLSFGCHQLAMPEAVLDYIERGANIQQLHLASVPPLYRSQQRNHDMTNGKSFLSNDSSCQKVLEMNNLTDLSLDWKYVTGPLLDALNRRTSPVPFKSFQVFFSHAHTCYADSHPALEQWEIFRKDHPDTILYLVFVYTVDGLCSGLQYIRMRTVVKLVENQQIQLDNFQRVIDWHCSRIEGLVFVNTMSSPVYDPASIMPLAAVLRSCSKVSRLSIIGRFIPSEAVLWMLQNFSLQELIVSKSHILTSAEASNYLVPISASKYTDFCREASNFLGRSWHAMTTQPFKHMNAYYFSDGIDNSLHLKGCMLE